VQVSEAGPPYGTLESQVSHYDQQVAQLLYANDRLLGQNNNMLLANEKLLALLGNMTQRRGPPEVVEPIASPAPGASPAPPWSPTGADDLRMSDGNNTGSTAGPRGAVGPCQPPPPPPPPGQPLAVPSTIWLPDPVKNPIQNAYVTSYKDYRSMCSVSDTDLTAMASSEACKNSGERYTDALAAQYNALGMINTLLVGAATGLFAVAIDFEADEVAWQWVAGVLVTAWTFVVLFSCIAVLVCTSFVQIATEYPPTWGFMQKIWRSFGVGGASTPFMLTIISATVFFFSPCITCIHCWLSVLQKA
jgi:hypothetical protein